MCDGGLVAIVSGWPRVSETFAQHELQALRRRGLLSAVFATKPGDHTVVQPATAELDDLVELLGGDELEAQVDEVVARIGSRPVRAVHGYFAHRPAALAEAVADRLGVPFGFSVHALDVRKVEPGELARRARRAAVVVSCNDDAATSMRAVGADPVLIRHGVALDRFHGDRPAGHGPVDLLAVGRLVEKKGFEVLVDAMALLPGSATLRIVGSGPLLDPLTARVDAAGVAGRVRFIGARTHAELPDLYRDADIVVVPSVVDAAGDRDGLPNVVLEAMATGCAVIASDVAAIPAAITSGVTGVLVPPGDPAALAAAIAALADDPEERMRVGKAARAEVERRFALDRCTDELCDLLIERYPLAPPSLPTPAVNRG